MRMSWSGAGGRALVACSAVAALVAGGGGAAHAGPVVSVSQHASVAMSATEAASGDTITFTMSITNDTSTGQSAGLRAYVERLAFPLFTSQASCTVVRGPRPKQCRTDSGGTGVNVFYSTGGQVPPHSTAEVAIAVTVSPDARPGTWPLGIKGLGSVAGEQFSPASLDLTIRQASADAAVGLTASAPPPGGAISYTQTVTDDGPEPISTAAVTTRLPAEATSVTSLPPECAFQAAAKVVTCTTGPVPVGHTASYTFQAGLGPLTVGRSVTATATKAASSPADPDPGNDQATASCVALTGLLVSC